VSVSDQYAASEMLRRQRARASLPEFSQAIDIPGVPLVDVADKEGPDGKLINRYEDVPVAYKRIELRLALHHLLIMQAVQRCMENPTGGRTMIFAPPGSAKSTYGAVIGPAWHLGKWPGEPIILASYATGIAAKQSRKVRSIMHDPQYTSLWTEKPRLSEDQRAIDDWSLTNGSSFMAAGLLAGITGNRARGIVIDDPVANREQADSAGIRQKTYDEFVDTAMTRLKPNGWVLMIQTRWHEEDLAGSILPADYNGESGLIECRDGQTWEVLCIPAEAEREDDVLGRKVGEFLWPEWFPAKHWSTWRNNPRAARTWAALYQQRPAPFTGIHFSVEMFKRFDPWLPRIDE
jgi:hypothetical protein